MVALDPATIVGRGRLPEPVRGIHLLHPSSDRHPTEHATEAAFERTSDPSRGLLWEVVILAAFCGMALLHEFSISTAHSVLFLVLLFVAYGALVAWPGDSVARRGRSSLPTRVGSLTLRRLLVIAAAVRLLASTFAFDLSDDVYRYLWDGKVLLAGANPYATSPDDPELAALRDEIWSSTAHRDVQTVYPPAAQALFALAAGSAELTETSPLIVWRLLVGIIDLFGCALLWLLCRRFAVPTGRAIWYAWNPLTVLEGVGMGHLDIAGTATLTCGILLLLTRHLDDPAGCATERRKQQRLAVGAGLVIAISILTKLVPLVALAALALVAGRRRSSRAMTFLASCAAVCVAAAAPILATVGVPPGLVRYGVSWEFNGPLFEPLWRLIDGVAAADGVKSLLMSAERGLAVDLHGVYPLVYPQLLAKAVLAMVLLTSLGMIFRRALSAVARLRRRAAAADADRVHDTRQLIEAVHWSLVAALLCSATLYPWYALWALPTAALLRDRFWLVVCCAIPLAYLPRLFVVPYHPWVYLAVWAPCAAAALFLLHRRWRSSRTQRTAVLERS